MTGDKQETAIEIAKSCNLVTPETDLIDLSSDTKEEFEQKLDQQVKGFDVLNKTFMELDQMSKLKQRPLAIVVNGSTLI